MHHSIASPRPGGGNFPQNDDSRVISGTVTGKSTKEPLAGVSIFIEGTAFFTTSDIDGRYSLSFVPSKDTKINFYFMGMEMETVAYTGQKTINVAMTEKNESLDDVVVTGYAKIRKEGFTGNVTRITKDELEKVSQKDVIGAIQVFDPSFRISENIQMGSNPNALPEFYMRGQTAVNMEFSSTADISRQNLTSNNNLPIFILDGFEVSMIWIPRGYNRLHF